MTMIQFASFCLWIFISGAFCARTVDVQDGESVIIPCDLAGTFEYPTWSGPSGLTNPLNNGQQINQQGFQWTNTRKDLSVCKAQTKYAGDYTCSYGGNSASVTLNVLYFQGPSIQFNKDMNSSFVNTSWFKIECSAYSDPNTSFEWVWVGVAALQNRSEVTTVCELGNQSVAYPNRCTSTYKVTPVKKEDNGANVKCYIFYPNKPQNKTDIVVRNISIIFDYYPSNHYLTSNQLPITTIGNVELTCSTDHTYPEPDLKWFRGRDENIQKNEELVCTKKTLYVQPFYEMLYSISENLVLNVDKSMNGEKIYCCIVYGNAWTNLCVSRLISLSDSERVSSSIHLLLWCLLMMKWLLQ